MTRPQILTRATLAALVVTIVGGGLLRFVLGASSDEFLIGRYAILVTVGQVLMFPLTIALTWWRLASRSGASVPPTIAVVTVVSVAAIANRPEATSHLLPHGTPGSDAMSRNLYVSDKHTWPLDREPLRVTNEGGGPEYEGRHKSWQSALLVDAKGDTVAAVTRRRWSSIWSIELDDQRFEMRAATFRSRWEAIGGPWHGATIRGDLFYYLPCEAECEGRVLARASGRVVNERSAHRIEILSSRLEDERFIIAALLAMRLRKDEQKW